MKLVVALIIGIGILNVEARKFRRKSNAGPKFLATDTELATKEKIQTFVTTTLQFTLATIDDIHYKSDRTFDGVLSDISLRAAYITANLIENFRKYRDAYQRYKAQPRVPSCVDRNYAELEHSTTSLQTRTVECRDTAITDIQIIKREINENTSELKNGLKHIIALVNTCASPWIPGESVKCAKQRAEQIRRTVSDLQDIAKTAHQNILRRLDDILQAGRGCANNVINGARSVEKRLLEDIHACAAELKINFDI